MKKECNIFVPLGCYQPCFNDCVQHEKPIHPKNICIKTCGSFFLDQNTEPIIIWENLSHYTNIVTICIFNSSNSPDNITVNLQNNTGGSFTVMIPPGNSSARTIANLKSAAITCIQTQLCQGSYELNICIG